MSAIEIMDPKMDSGYNNSEDMTLEKAQASGILSENLSNEEIVNVIDRLLMYYLLWLDGHTIVQTCWCCLYLQDPARLLRSMPALAAFVDAFLIACRKARDLILAGQVYDDEDFVPTMFKVDLQACAVSSVPSEVSKNIRTQRARLSESNEKDADALACRLEFFGEYTQALMDLSDTGPAKSKPGARKVRFAGCSQALEKLEQHMVPPSEKVLKCFDASINRKYLVPGPPRTVETIEDSKVVMGMWTSHLHELELCGSLSEKELTDLLQGAVTYKNQPNILPRSVAQLCVSEPGFVRRLVLESIQQHLFPPEALQHCKKPTETFLKRCEAMFLHMLKLAHLNNARKFRRLAHAFPDFNNLQHEAWQLDETLKQTFGANLQYLRPCWVWIMEHALQAMISKLLLGFQLELYDEAEFHMIYWYVDYLFGLRIYNLNEIFYVKEQGTGAGKKKNARQQKDQQAAGKGNKPKNPPVHLLLLEATQHTVRGLFRLLAFCLRRGLLCVPPAAEAGLPQRFVLRFRSLEQFRLPHLPSYIDFEQSAFLAQAPVESRSVLAASQGSLLEASQLLESISTRAKDGSTASDACGDMAKALKRVVVANQLAATQLLRIVDSGQDPQEQKKVLVEAAHHPNFVSLQVVAR
eukprot:TRINITY_DN26155_c0_g1_i1.p1 TRINITY_DN26155_c0_g1~~TRINITY_DN26155_c0_g1_i1.p1  ORF type:complete len:739 (+),score=193.05 TRINITY_DN26155_c0_g1_i1:305-2218(+)